MKKIPLNPPFSKGEVSQILFDLGPIPLFDKEGLGEICVLA